MVWTEERISDLKNRYSTEGPVRLASEWGGIKPTAIIAQAWRLGITKKRSKYFEWTQEKDAELARRCGDEGFAELAREWKISYGAVAKHALNLGLHTDGGHYVSASRRVLSSKSVDIHFFEKWTNEMAYVLGFLFADGNVCRGNLSIGLHAKDGYILERFRELLKIERELVFLEANTDPRGIKTGPQARLIVGSKYLVKTLTDIHGLHPKKSNRNDPMPEIADEFFPHFARGFFDGDGHVCLSGKAWMIGLTGQSLFITQMRDRISDTVGVSKNTVYQRTGSVSTAWAKQSDVLRLARWLSPLGTDLFLTRKRERLLLAIESIGKKLPIKIGGA